MTSNPRPLSRLQLPMHGNDSVWTSPDGTRFHFSAPAPVSLARVGTNPPPAPPTNRVEAAWQGLQEARTLLVEGLGLPAPAGLEIRFTSLGSESRGYVISRSGDDPRTILVLSDSNTLDAARSNAIHQYGHAVVRTLHPRFSPDWGEALATWAGLRLEGVDQALADRFSERIAQLPDGQFRGTDRVAGDVLWLSFLEQAYGSSTVRVTLAELAQGLSDDAALDRAIRRTSDDDLSRAFREFHLWTVFTGDRADRFHFDFAHQVDGWETSTVEGLPALSVQTDPAVARWGAAQVSLRPDELRGGIQILFDGEFSASWDVDLLLFGGDGTPSRVAMDLSADGRGDVTLPLDGVDEILLMIRNTGGEDDAALRYTYAAHADRSFPFELTSLEALADSDGVHLSWETASERELIGFNILRERADGTQSVVVNPIWIPTLGDRHNATSYQFVDLPAEPGIDYLYRVQGITELGLTSQSDPIEISH